MRKTFYLPTSHIKTRTDMTVTDRVVVIEKKFKYKNK